MLDISRFDFTTYRAIIELLGRNHNIVSFAGAHAGEGGERWCILRHDIDYSPEAALAMAKVERDMGVKSTYFLLMNSPFYNLLEPDYTSFPRALTKLGHDVGLHYDGAVLEEQADDADRAKLINGYVGILSAMSGQPVTTVSMHNPSLFSGEDIVTAQGEYIDAYDPVFSQGVAYISDSCGAWRDNAFDLLTGITPLPPRLQLLVHPIFWSADHKDRWKCMEDALLQSDSRARKLAGHYASYWTKHEGVIQHDLRNRDNRKP